MFTFDLPVAAATDRKERPLKSVTTHRHRHARPSATPYLDLTDDLQRAIKDAGVTDGAAIAFCAHTTCALLINEWEDGAMADFRRHLTELVPHDGVYYEHDDFDIRTQNMHEDERTERPRPREGHAAVGHLARHPRRGGRARASARGSG